MLTLQKQIHEVLEFDEGMKEGNPFQVKTEVMDNMWVFTSLHKGDKQIGRVIYDKDVLPLRNVELDVDFNALDDDEQKAYIEFTKQIVGEQAFQELSKAMSLGRQ